MLGSELCRSGVLTEEMRQAAMDLAVVLVDSMSSYSNIDSITNDVRLATTIFFRPDATPLPGNPPFPTPCEALAIFEKAIRTAQAVVSADLRYGLSAAVARYALAVEAAQRSRRIKVFIPITISVGLALIGGVIAFQTIRH